MYPTLLGLLALALEIAAWGQLHFGTIGDDELLLYLALHAAASLLLAGFAYMFLPSRFSTPRVAVLGLLFCLIFFVPALGFIGVLVAPAVLPLMPRFAPRLMFRSVQLPALDPHERPPSRPTFSQAGVRGFLSNAKAPAALRLRALVALQQVPPRLSNPLLRSVLGDQVEDLRLLAHGMLDSRERRLNARLHDELQRHRRLRDDRDRAVSSYRLAQLFWELIYEGLVQGDLASHALGHSLDHTRTALLYRPDDAALHLQLGRLLHMSGQLQPARSAYQEALGLGIPLTRVVPFLAELAYDEGDVAEARRLMSALSEWQWLPRLKPVINYWKSR